MFEIVPVVLADGTCPYASWLRRQATVTQVVVDALIREVLAHEGTNVCRTEFGKSLGKGLYELRARQSPRTIFNRVGQVPRERLENPDQEILVRIFFAMDGDQAVLLLGGIDKGKASSKKAQHDQIEAARRVLSRYQREKRAISKHRRR